MLDILIPIGIGAGVNLLILFIAFAVTKSMGISIALTYVSTAILFALSFKVSGWEGMGLFVITVGMLAAAVVLHVRHAVSKIKMKARNERVEDSRKDF